MASSFLVGEMVRVHSIRKAISAQETLVGCLPNSYYNELVSFLGELNAKKGEIRRACVPPLGLLAEAIAPHSLCWWGFYELPILRTVSFVAQVMGLAETLSAAGNADNPSLALMDSMRGEIDGELVLLDPLDRAVRALLIGAILSLINSIDATRQYGLTMDELLAKEGNGAESALRKAVSIDPLAIATRTGTSIVAARILAGDHTYAAKLLAAKVPSKRRASDKLRFLHRILKDLDALKGLPAEKLVDLVCGTLNLYTPCADAGKNLKELFRRFESDTTT